MWADCEMQSLLTGVYGVLSQAFMLWGLSIIYCKQLVWILASFPNHAESAIAEAHLLTKLTEQQNKTY